MTIHTNITLISRIEFSQESRENIEGRKEVAVYFLAPWQYTRERLVLNIETLMDSVLELVLTGLRGLPQRGS